MPSARKKLLLFPPMQTFATASVSVANGGITTASFAAGAIDNNAIAAAALTGRLVKSLQAFEIIIAPGTFSNTATIAAVNLNRSVMLLTGQSYDPSGNWPGQSARLVFTNATTITATRGNNGGSDTTTIEGLVLELF